MVCMAHINADILGARPQDSFVGVSAWEYHIYFRNHKTHCQQIALIVFFFVHKAHPAIRRDRIQGVLGYRVKRMSVPVNCT